MVEEILVKYLNEVLDVEVSDEVQDGSEFVVLERTGGSESNHISSATVAIQSYAPSLYGAAQLNEKVKKAMSEAVALDPISSAKLNADYNFTDTTKKLYRYQAIYDLVYFND